MDKRIRAGVIVYAVESNSMACDVFSLLLTGIQLGSREGDSSQYLRIFFSIASFISDYKIDNSHTYTRICSEVSKFHFLFPIFFLVNFSNFSYKFHEINLFF